MATVQITPEQRVLLHNVSWQTYETLLEEVGGRGTRLTYDNGSLEIMTVSHGHESYARLIGRFIECLTEELNIPVHSGGSTTFKREAKKRGLEPDECYWIEKELLMRGKKEFDIDSDPPPDLAIEVEVSRSALNRMAIYATLGIREVWRFDTEELTVWHLRGDGRFTQADRSRAFPFLPLAEVVRFIRASDTQEETTLVRSFRQWVREDLLPAWEEGKAEKQGKRKSGKRKPK
jgi:Uma2 family endonuclease